MTNIKFVGGMAYDRFAGASETEGLQTGAAFLGGTTGSGGDGPYLRNRDMNVSFTPRGSNSLASDIVKLRGTAGPTFADPIVLQLTYDEATAIALFGGESAVRLGWLDAPANQWSLAVAAHTGGSPFFAGDGAYDPGFDFVLGATASTPRTTLSGPSLTTIVTSRSSLIPFTSVLMVLALFFILKRLRTRRTWA